VYINSDALHTKLASLQSTSQEYADSKGDASAMASGQSRSSNVLVVPQANQALDQMKYEVAQELGIQIPQDGYMGYMATRDTGAIGGHITRRLVQIAEQQLAGSSR
jgi:uncharacterized protein (DUF3084 family)